jgi:hypothetical protein
MQFGDIARRVAAMCDDPDQTYLTNDYILGLAPVPYDWLYGNFFSLGISSTSNR